MQSSAPSQQFLTHFEGSRTSKILYQSISNLNKENLNGTINGNRREKPNRRGGFRVTPTIETYHGKYITATLKYDEIEASILLLDSWIPQNIQLFE